MDFKIDPDAEVRLAHLNVRTEKHGEDDVTAIDLKLEWQTSNLQLAQFHPDLRESLYAPEPGHQKKIAGVEPAMLTRLFPSLKVPIGWEGETTGRVLTIRHGINASTDLKLPDCTVDKFRVTPLDGGTTKLEFRVRAVCEDERILGKLPTLLNRSLPMQLVMHE